MNTNKKPRHIFVYAVLIFFWILLTLANLWPVIARIGNSKSVAKSPSQSGVNYLVVAPQALQKIAFAWADYRSGTGYQTQVMLVSPDQANGKQVREAIRTVYEKSGQPDPFNVLLIGHAHPLSSHPEAFLPAAYFTIDPAQFSGYGMDPIASDDGLVRDLSDPTSDEHSSISIGRIPVRDEEEGWQLLNRVKAYEENPPEGEGRARVELILSNAGFGPQYEPLFNTALKVLRQEILPAEYRWHTLNGNSQSPYAYPASLFPEEVARRFDSNALAVVYVGHGQPDLLGWAYSPGGERGRIFNVDDAKLIQNANDSIGIFTACSASKYDLPGDDLSVVESIFLQEDGPVATYSSSAWINGSLNGRLLLDVLEDLLTERSSTLGGWINRVEAMNGFNPSRNLSAELIRTTLPNLSSLYEKKLILSSSQASQALRIQHATYNLFGDPAMRIVYAEKGVEVVPQRLWQPWNGTLSFSGISQLPAGQWVMITLESLPGNEISTDSFTSGSLNRYYEANNPLISMMETIIMQGGNFSGKLEIPAGIPGGKYLLRAVSVQNGRTYVSAHPVFLGWPPISRILFNPLFGWFLVSTLLVIMIFRYPLTTYIRKKIRRKLNG